MTHEQARALLEGLVVNLSIQHLQIHGVKAVDARAARQAVDHILSQWRRDDLGEVDLGERDRDRAARAVAHELNVP